MTFAAFILASLAILLTPGPTNTLLAASGAAAGFRNACLLPAAEAMGYAVAIALFYAAGTTIQSEPLASAAIKALTALWLFYSAARLWLQPVMPPLAGHRTAFWPVFVTTLLNPKSMLVGMIVIPSLLPGQFHAAIATFIVLALLAGTGWVLLGASLPAAIRRHSYKAAAVVVLGFSATAAASSLYG